MILAIDIALVVLLVAVGLAVIWVRNLFAVVMLFSIYSLLMASLFVILDAVDVAFTEASVGAGISTVLMLGVLTLVRSREKIPVSTPLVPLVIVAVTGALLVYGTSGLPAFGDPDAPSHQHVAPYYIAESEHETGAPNIVTAVLASYRGYDTMGETGVIFTAGVGVLLLLGGAARRRRKNGGADQAEERP